VAKNEASPRAFEVDSKSASAAFGPFVTWAGEEREAVRVLFGPDTIMAIDTPSRSGYLIDEVYFLTAWIQRGADDFRHELEGVLASVEREADLVVEEPSEEPDFFGMLAMVVDRGSPIDDVRRLL
jgi:hypothetical protein